MVERCVLWRIENNAEGEQIQRVEVLFTIEN